MRVSNTTIQLEVPSKIQHLLVQVTRQQHQLRGFQRPQHRLPS